MKLPSFIKKKHATPLFWVAGGLTGAEAVINMLGVDKLPVPQWARGVLILVVVGGAFVTRMLAQQEAPVGASDAG